MAQDAPSKKENPLYNLVFDVILPAVILSKFSREDRLGPVAAVLLAFTIPLGHGLYGLWKERKFGVFPMVGLIGVALSGGLTLLKLDAKWIAVKEAAVPAVLGIAVIASMRTRFPFVKKMLFNDTILNIAAIEKKVVGPEQKDAVERLLERTSWLIATSFFLSSILNYILAEIILISDPGSVAFNEELGKMQLMSYPVIVLPCMVVTAFSLWFLLRGLKNITGLDTETILKQDVKPEAQPN